MILQDVRDMKSGTEIKYSNIKNIFINLSTYSVFS